MDNQPPLLEPDEWFDQWMSDRRYRNVILEVLGEIVERLQNFTSEESSKRSIRTVSVFDEAHNQYQILEMGWNESGHRVFQPIIHLELLDGKIWIQENVTDVDLVKELLEWEVETSDIVLGMHSENL
jgi:XisI protein